jgi:hypothetical protein
MKTITIIFISLFTQQAFAQIKVIPLPKKDIPATIHFVGHIINSVRYTDNRGDHIILTTETGIVQTKDSAGSGFSKADLYAYHYDIKDNKQIPNWQLNDFVKDCPVEIAASYISNTFAITDLNNDGVAEVWLMYKTVCRGDVSPANMKIIMHEGMKKYAVRGTNKVKLSDKEFYGGAYTLDETFKSGPKVFRQYALQLWNKSLMEKWE